MAPSRWPSRPIEIRRHRSELGDWELATAAGDQSLRSFVVRYAGYRETSPGVVRRLEPASPNAMLLVSFGPDMRFRHAGMPDGTFQHIRSFVGGPTDSWSLTEYAGSQHGIQVDLGPLALARLVGDDVGSMTGGPVGLEDVFGATGSRLTEQLAGTEGWPARFALLEAFLKRRFDQGRPVPPPIDWAVRRMQSTGGRVTVGAMVREIGWSKRHFIARFRSAVGLAPGRYGRLLRFRHAVRLLDSGGQPLSDVALAAGYYDQAHLDRDFRQFAGRPPTDFIARRLPDGFGVAG